MNKFLPQNNRDVCEVKCTDGQIRTAVWRLYYKDKSKGVFEIQNSGTNHSFWFPVADISPYVRVHKGYDLIGWRDPGKKLFHALKTFHGGKNEEQI